MAGVEGDHGPVEESPAVGRAAAHDGEVGVGEGQEVEVADELLERRGLAVKREGLFGPPQRDAEGALEAAALDDPLDAAFRLPVPDAVPGGGGAEAAPVGQEIDRFQDVGLPLPVAARKEGDAGAGVDLELPDVAIVEESKPAQAHA